VLDDHDIDRLFAPLTAYPRVALAVSGGGDSIALMLLVSEWIARASMAPECVVVTVDHGLRRDSRREAEWVAERAAAAGFRHQILTWTDRPAHVSQAIARQARYDLLNEFARDEDVAALVTAHTCDDIAETFLMRLARGSGIDGLAAMGARTTWNGLPLVRPLLGVSRKILRDILVARGQSWLEDPGNTDEERFERARVRKALITLEELGITADSIAESAGRLRRARYAIESMAADFLSARVEVDPGGYVRLPSASFRALPAEIAIHVLTDVIRRVAGRARPPRLRKLEMLTQQIREAGSPAVTLGGCVVAADAAREEIVVCREPGRLSAPALTLSAGETVTWDGRFRISASASLPGTLRVDRLGDKNIAFLPEETRRSHPAAALACLPALYDDDGVLAGIPLTEFSIFSEDPVIRHCRAVFIWENAAPQDGA